MQKAPRQCNQFLLGYGFNQLFQEILFLGFASQETVTNFCFGSVEYAVLPDISYHSMPEAVLYAKHFTA